MLFESYYISDFLGVKVFQIFRDYNMKYRKSLLFNGYSITEYFWFLFSGETSDFSLDSSSDPKN